MRVRYRETPGAGAIGNALAGQLPEHARGLRSWIFSLTTSGWNMYLVSILARSFSRGLRVAHPHELLTPETIMDATLQQDVHPSRRRDDFLFIIPGSRRLGNSCCR